MLLLLLQEEKEMIGVELMRRTKEESALQLLLLLLLACCSPQARTTGACSFSLSIPAERAMNKKLSAGEEKEKCEESGQVFFFFCFAPPLFGGASHKKVFAEQEFERE